ncbi:MAG: PPC domain-containing protein [Planctomycetaceae bacterium]|nr:PPC domain-containing protein [Planctomycetaceae bacterium]
MTQRRPRTAAGCLVLVTLAFGLLPWAAVAQPQPPSYAECRLDGIYPNGGRRGTTVTVEFRGAESGLSDPTAIVVDGPPGVSAIELIPVDGRTLRAKLEITADAPLGRRWLRVASARSGLTNFSYFVVSDTNEFLEAEPNNVLTAAETVEMPIIVNGRIQADADLDVFRFAGRAGQRIVAAIAAHRLDVHGQNRNYGVADFSLELLDADGRTLAASEDALGFDPVIEAVLPAEGSYAVRVQHLNYSGYPEAVYRLSLGELPIATAVFPAGGQRGTPIDAELTGPNVPLGTHIPLSNTPQFEADPAFPLQFVTAEAVDRTGIDLPLIVGELPESLEAEPNNQREEATALAWPATVNGRFDEDEDADWYRIAVTQGEPVWIEVHAQRFLQSPIDSLLQVYDAAGKLLVENDDETFDPGYECYHDYNTTDSRLTVTPMATGELFIRVSDQAGQGDPRAVYRLTVRKSEPEFRLSHFPDAVPVWGSGCTAALLVRIDRFNNCQDDIELSVEGLPEGWTSSIATSLGATPERANSLYQLKVFLTVTAPQDAVPGTHAPFRVVGRAKRPDGSVVERHSLPLTLFYTSDTGFFRASPVSRVAVAKPQGPWLEALVTELTLPPGGSANIPVKVHGNDGILEMPTTISLATLGVACGLMTPRNLPIRDGLIEVPLTLPDNMAPGEYGILIAQSWRNDIRIGMPGPCTTAVKVRVVVEKPASTP